MNEKNTLRTKIAVAAYLIWIAVVLIFYAKSFVLPNLMAFIKK